ncbi:radical SAM family heme chaperone HemW, partial [candidate division KSB1 bacterium]|nr:radical SAM family heme chaperone HemW [candidate division KSB1 bacterium]
IIISTIISHSSLDISHLEVSIEANPGTADKAKLKALHELGINRLSIGAQSFNNHHLKVLGRIHTAEETFRFYDDARSVGFDNINFDLIFALPDQTLDEWKKDLQTAINLNPDHLSTYDLVLHENSPLKSLLRTQNSELPTEETELAMYEHTIETLIAAGFKHYEIGNFAKSGFECQHNIVYWKNGNYLGIGAGAHSHVDGKRWANSNSIEEYLKGAPRIPQDDLPAGKAGSPHATAIFMGLRLLDGLEVEKFNGFEKEVAELIEDGLLRRENNHYKLTRRGLYLGNLVFERFV